MIPPGNLGNSYAVPAMDGVDNWTVTSWSHQARSGTGQKLKLKVYRPLGGLAYRIVSHDVPRDVTENALNRFQTSVPAKAGDVVGFATVTGSATIGVRVRRRGADKPKRDEEQWIKLPLEWWWR